MELTDPAFDAAFVFTPTLDLRSKSNHRRAPGSSAWGQFRAFEDAIAFDARSQLPAAWPDLRPDRPLVERPAVALVIVASTTIDATNLPKSVADALEGICYANDASVRASTSLAVRSTSRRAAVALCALDRPTTLADLALAVHRLTLATVDYFITADASAGPR